MVQIGEGVGGHNLNNESTDTKNERNPNDKML